MIKPTKEISDKDLNLLYNYAEKINEIGKRYGLSSFTKIFINAINQLDKKRNNINKNLMEFGAKKK